MMLSICNCRCQILQKDSAIGLLLGAGVHRRRLVRAQMNGSPTRSTTPAAGTSEGGGQEVDCLLSGRRLKERAVEEVRDAVQGNRLGEMELLLWETGVTSPRLA